MANTFKIIKDKAEYEKGKFGQFSHKGFGLAAQKLNRNGLLLWLYLCDNRDGYEFTLSPTAISNSLGVSIDVAKAMTKSSGGIKELTDAGFIRDGKFYAEGCSLEGDTQDKTEEQSENLTEKAIPAHFIF